MRKLYAILSPYTRKRLTLLLVAYALLAICEVLGIVSMLPFLTVVLNPNRLLGPTSHVRPLLESWGMTDVGQLVRATGLFSVTALVLSNSLSAFLTAMAFRFSGREQHEMSAILFRRYLSRPYLWFALHNSADLSKKVLLEVHHAVVGVLIPTCRLYSKLLTVSLILIGLLILNPWVALSTGLVLGSAYLLIYHAIRHRLRSLGEQRSFADRRKYRVAAESFQGIRETIIRGRENHFLQQFAVYSALSARTTAQAQSLSELPRYLVETLALCGVILSVVAIASTGQNFAAMIPLLGTFIFASYRLLPALQQVFSNLAIIRSHLNSVEQVYDELFNQNLPIRDLNASEKALRMPLQTDIRLDNLTFSYPQAPQPTIDRLNLTIAKNQSVAFVGTTGAGKSTLIGLLLGLFRPDSGEIRVDGVALTPETISCWQRNVGLVSQDIFLLDGTVKGNIAYCVPEDKIDLEAVIRASEMANLHSFIDALPEKYETAVGERGVRLSGGQKQRLGIARALYADPDILVLDEATSSLDGKTEEAVMEAIHNLSRKKTLIMIAHRLSTVRNCDVIFFLHSGQVRCAGTFEELLERDEAFRAMAEAGAMQGRKG